jgi:predicted amidophosphoribosyltransferase
MKQAHGMETTGIAPVSRDEAIAALAGATCPFCGAPKRRMQTCCRICFGQLTPSLQAELRRRIGHGFEKAYAIAGQWLREVNAE